MALTLDFFEKLRQNLQSLPDHPALQILSNGERDVYTYRRIVEELTRVSLFLQKAGVRPGEAVGIVMENHPRWGISYLAAQSAGAVVVPLDILHGEETLAYLIQHSECRFLITSQEMSSRARGILQRLDGGLPVLTTGPAEPGWASWEEVISTVPDQEIPMPLVRRDPEEPLSIMYTSGTTGNPKGVILSEKGIYRNVVAVLTLIRITPRDHILSVLPLYHALALMANFIIPLYIGGRVTYMSVLEAQKILQAFRDEGITIFVAVPQFFNLVYRRIQQEVENQGFLKRRLFRALLGLSRFSNGVFGLNPGKLFFERVHRQFGRHFRLFAVGGARFDPKIAQAFRDLGFKVVQAYGLTETSAVATVTTLSSRSVGSVGAPLPHCRIRVDEPDDNGIGEILIGGDSIMMGYLHNPSATEEVLRDGWLYSGDLGYLDGSGLLHITGRKKDVIVLSSGKNIFPEELEHFYQTHCESILEICILGVPDETSEEGQEKLHAVIVPDFEVLKRQQIVNILGLARFQMENASQKLPPHKRVRSYEIRRSPLPRTTTRKIKRFQVAAEMGQAPPAPASSSKEEKPDSAVEARIYKLIRQMKRAPSLRPEMSLELDVGFDSLQRVEFLSNVQDAFRVEISDDEASEIFTLQDLIQAVEERLSGEFEGSGPRRSWSEILQEPLQGQDAQIVSEILRPRPLAEFALFLIARTVYWISKIFFRLRIEGLENLPREQVYLLCPNHLSFLDAPLLVSGLPRRELRRLFFLGFADYFSRGIMGKIGLWTKTVPVDPDRHLRQALQIGAEGLRRNLVMCVFPEGERSIDGTTRTFKNGPSILSEALRIPVVPVGIRGTFEAWPRSSGRIRPRPVRIRIGRPLSPPDGQEAIPSYTRDLKKAVEDLVAVGK